MWRYPFSAKAAASVLVLASLLFSGCGGGDDVERYHVSGKVTFRNQPIPAGTIIFEPDASKGNSGPQGFAEIKNGEFNTQLTGKGTVGGPHRITVEGTDGIAKDEGNAAGSPLFPPYTTTIDLPKETTQQDIEVIDFSR